MSTGSSFILVFVCSSHFAMKIAVIGAGFSGLMAIRHLKEAGLFVDCYEQSSTLGGTWRYSDRTGLDENGLPVHSSMYKNLSSNVPKELIGFPDLPFWDTEASFVTHSNVLNYIRRYTKAFDLMQHIKFEHQVIYVKPLTGNRWSVEVQDFVKEETRTVEYDGVFICNGHYSVPLVPKVKGGEHFKGTVMHSHDYRVPNKFEGQRVLVFGGGPSGVDVALEESTVAKYVALSHHMKLNLEGKCPQNFEEKSDIAQILEDGSVEFHDGSRKTFDAIIFCTGYHYSYPFLSPKCKIKIKDSHVTPLWMVSTHTAKLYSIIFWQHNGA